MLKIVFLKIKYFDSRVTDYILKFLAPHLTLKTIPFLTARLHLFIKIFFYSSIILIPFLFLKFLYPEDNKISRAIFIILCLIWVGIVGTFFGFLQIFFV